MKISVTKILAITAFSGMLSACSMTVTPEQRAALTQEHAPKVNAFIPACIATASGQKADYSAILAMGYTRRDAVIGNGDYLYPSSGRGLLSHEGIKFIPGQGCESGNDNVLGVAGGGFQAIGDIWMNGLRSAGYQQTSDGNASYRFTANGVNMAFTGSQNTRAGEMTFSIKRIR